MSSCYYIHHVKALSDCNIEELLSSSRLIESSGADNDIFKLNLRKCSEKDYEEDAKVIDNMSETWDVKCINNMMLYTSRTASDTPVFYISKAFPEIVFEEVNSFEACADENYEIRKWLNGECI